MPRLAGQNAEYLSSALSSFMQPIAQNLSDAETRQLSDYFARQNARGADPAAATSPQLALGGKQLAETGAGNVPARFSCRAPQGKGNGARERKSGGTWHDDRSCGEAR